MCMLDKLFCASYCCLVLLMSGCGSHHVFYDTSGRQVSRAQFKKQVNLRLNKYSTKLIDGHKVTSLYPNHSVGKLNPDALKSVQQKLKLMSEDIDVSKPLCIGLFRYTLDEWGNCCADNYLARKDFDDYENYIRVVNFLVKPQDRYLPFYYDKDNFLKETFFPEDLACDHWMVLRPNGEYQIHYGETGSWIFDYVDVEWDDAISESYYESQRQLEPVKYFKF